MAVGLQAPQDLKPVIGTRLSIAYAGIRKANKPDVVLIEIAKNSRVAAVFTQNQFCAAPVLVAKEHLRSRSTRYLLINAGNANAGTGRQGEEAARRSCSSVAEQAGCNTVSVLPFSTGVIGEHLPVEKIEKVMPELFNKLSADGWLDAAQGIMTTDTVAKAVSKQIVYKGKTVTITGIAKGAGMICPDMATMLGFIATDADITQDLLKKLQRQAVAQSFNAITIDGDTSTNDACVLIATGGAKVAVREKGAFYRQFVSQLMEVYRLLAQAIVRDAEGATKFVTVRVEGGAKEDGCRKIAYAIAHSPLVKTALFASDANWGRIVAAAGRAGVKFDAKRVSLSVNGVTILAKGQKSAAYTEERGSAAMAAAEIEIIMNLGAGRASACVWTSDLSHEYVSINADYRS
jgi:glutamate N-acetyltransferase/amino-acid N-acetyltransferase